ncbi:MAG: Sapep family Mn(2+)-dependent dipeptidase [Clostridia bacterium]|nr:Sapep family Mn(2+)-dependent dipeptidase [Clostridia bacterium]
MNLFDEALKRISEIIKFDSSQKPPLKGMPFGKGAFDCLEYFLKLAASYGFETKNYDGYAGEVIFGEGEEFAILAHLDVVPAGGGWAHDPFGGEIDTVNKKIWGRGAMDDKGPAILTLLAMKELKDNGFVPKKKIKLIVGCNEESGWACIDYYKAHANMPDTGFSPDADFPVIYAEKGILQLELSFAPGDRFCGLTGGERANMVCDYCEVSAQEDKAMLEKYNLEFKDGKVVSHGKSAHGSTPEMGVNAIKPVLKYLELNEMEKLLFEDGFGICSLFDETGKLTFSPNVINQTEDGIKVICDVRYPATLKREQVLNAISAKGVSYKILHEQAPLFNDKQSGLITTLLTVYNEVTGKNAKPVAIGGGTYARALKCGVAFGPEEEGEENTVHQANEYITFEKIEKCLKIYRLAIERLC